MKKNFKDRSSGFTLIELMVVITIIAIIAAVGLIVYSGITKRARDQRRIADVNQIATALEKGYKSGSYQPILTSDFQNAVIPADPATNKVNCGTGAAKACDYCLYVGNGASPAENSGGSAGTCGANGTISGSVVIPNLPAAGTTVWLLCANLETNSGPNGTYYFCKQNSQ